MEKLEELGKRLRELRKERGLLQRQMAEMLHITDVHYRRIEAGKVNIPTFCWAGPRIGKGRPCRR